MHWGKTRKENIKGEEQKYLALGMDNTFCARAHTTVEEVQREVCAQNESTLAAHLKGEHSINRCRGARQNGLALKLILHFSNAQRTQILMEKLMIYRPSNFQRAFPTSTTLWECSNLWYTGWWGEFRNRTRLSCLPCLWHLQAGSKMNLTISEKET